MSPTLLHVHQSSHTPPSNDTRLARAHAHVVNVTTGSLGIHDDHAKPPVGFHGVLQRMKKVVDGHGAFMVLVDDDACVLVLVLLQGVRYAVVVIFKAAHVTAA